MQPPMLPDSDRRTLGILDGFGGSFLAPPGPLPGERDPGGLGAAQREGRGAQPVRGESEAKSRAPLAQAGGAIGPWAVPMYVGLLTVLGCTSGNVEGGQQPKQDDGGTGTVAHAGTSAAGGTRAEMAGAQASTPLADGDAGAGRRASAGAAAPAGGAQGAAGEPDAAAGAGTPSAGTPSAGTGSVEETAGDAATASGASVQLRDGALWVEGAPFQIQGVCWNPVPRGGVHPADLDYAGFAESDAALMRQAGINAVRTYSPLTDVAALDALHAAGIFVLNSVYVWGGEDPSAVDGRVNAVKDHPAILMWVLGNEWNYNGLYVGLSHAQARDALNEAAARIRALDAEHPIATVYGEIPSAELVEAMPQIDIWGINAYRGLSFGPLFDQFAAISDKPMFMGEYGADAYNANRAMPDPQAQAEATENLTLEILAHSPARGAQGQCLGGTLFEWADEWWKDSGGTPDVQDVGGIAPGGGPHPDQVFNEEWWGIVDIDRTIRPAYRALQRIYTSP